MPCAKWFVNECVEVLVAIDTVLARARVNTDRAGHWLTRILTQVRSDVMAGLGTLNGVTKSNVEADRVSPLDRARRIAAGSRDPRRARRGQETRAERA